MRKSKNQPAKQRTFNAINFARRAERRQPSGTIAIPHPKIQRCNLAPSRACRRAAETNFHVEPEALAELARRNRLAPDSHLDAVGKFVLAARLTTQRSRAEVVALKSNGERNLFDRERWIEISASKNGGSSRRSVMVTFESTQPTAFNSLTINVRHRSPSTSET